MRERQDTDHGNLPVSEIGVEAPPHPEEGFDDVAAAVAAIPLWIGQVKGRPCTVCHRAPCKPLDNICEGCREEANGVYEDDDGTRHNYGRPPWGVATAADWRGLVRIDGKGQAIDYDTGQVIGRAS